MDFESVGSDMENAVWNETAETNYFKMMMEDNQTGRVKNQDNMDDSVAGGETLASVMNGGNNNGCGADVDADTIDGYSLSTDVAQLPNETMSIVGVEDDVSTIANDTVNETTRSFFSGNGSSRADSKPRIRLFKEYITPEKKHKNKGSSSRNSKSEDKIPNGNTDNNDNNDDETLPETPPGMIRVPGQSTTSSYRKDEGKVRSNSGKDVSSSVPTRRVYIIAGVLALVLFASIIALGVALKGMRGGDYDNNNSPTYLLILLSRVVGAMIKKTMTISLIFGQILMLGSIWMIHLSLKKTTQSISGIQHNLLLPQLTVQSIMVSDISS